MEFEWDDDKEAENVRKHDVSFDLAALVFLDPMRRTEPDERFVYDEDRSMTVGEIRGRLYVVIHTERENVTRIISARRATRQEKRFYGNDPHDA